MENEYIVNIIDEPNIEIILDSHNPEGQKGDTGNGIANIAKTSTAGLVDTYTITYTNGSATTFNVTNGNGISSIAKTDTTGLVDTYTISFTDGNSTTFTVTNGSSISSIEKTSTSGLVDTYTITLTNGDTSTFTVTNGKDGVDGTDGESAEITGATASVTNTVGTPSVTVTAGGTSLARSFDFAFTNLKGDTGDTGATGNGIVSIEKTGTSGLVDTYTITYTNGDTDTFTVTNGQNGTGSVSDVQINGVSILDDDVANIIITDNVTSTSTTSALSANQGKVLQDEISHLQGIGRFLALWDATTGLAETNPPVSPYTYKTGDYFIVGIVGATNYKPSGSSYTTGVASTTVETETIEVGNVYYYDGTTWKLQAGGGGGTITDVQVNGTSVVTSGVANIPLISSSNFGVAKVSETSYGIGAYSTGHIFISSAPENIIVAKASGYRPIVPSNLDIAIREGLGNYSGTAWTDAYKASARTTIGAQATLVSGTNIKTINNNSILGSGNLSIDSLPSQTGQSGKYLTTNGTTASWANTPNAVIFRDWS